MRSLTVNGKLSFSDALDLELKSEWILLAGGELDIGTEAKPYTRTATARLVFTEITTEKQGDAPKILTQGREFDTLIKRNGRWWIAKRQIFGPKGVPEGWQE